MGGKGEVYDEERRARLQYRSLRIIAEILSDPFTDDKGRQREAWAWAQTVQLMNWTDEEAEQLRPPVGVDVAQLDKGVAERADALVRLWNTFVEEENLPLAESLSDVLSGVRQLKAAIKNDLGEESRLLSKAQELVEHSEVLVSQRVDELADFVEKTGLHEHHEAEETTTALLERKAMAYRRKLDLVESQTSRDISSNGAREAVEAITERAIAMTRADEAELEKVQQQLASYRTSRFDFDALAKRYAGVLDEGKELRRTLRELDPNNPMLRRQPP